MSVLTALFLSLNAPFILSVVTETLWAYLVSLVAGLAYANAEHMNLTGYLGSE